MSDYDFDLTELPDKAQEYIRNLRRESAKYRTERNEARDKIVERDEAVRQANEKFKEFDKVQSDYEKSLAENSRLLDENGRMKAAGEAGVFTDWNRLQGKSADEWAEDAKGLAGRLSGAQGGDEDKKPGVNKDDAATKKPAEGKESPLAKAFREAGFDVQ